MIDEIVINNLQLALEKKGVLGLKYIPDIYRSKLVNIFYLFNPPGD